MQTKNSYAQLNPNPNLINLNPIFKIQSAISTIQSCSVIR